MTYCDTFWGSHGCYRERGHRGRHRCGLDGCGSTGYGWGTLYFGEDAPRWQLLARFRHQLRRTRQALRRRLTAPPYYRYPDEIG